MGVARLRGNNVRTVGTAAGRAIDAGEDILENSGDIIEKLAGGAVKFPKDALIEENLGLSLWSAKDVDRAIDSFTQLGSYGGDAALRAQFYLGQIGMEKADYKGAVDHFLKVEPADAHDIGLPPEKRALALAQAYQKAAMLPEAKAAYEKLLTLTPNDAKAKSALRDINRRLPKKPKKS